MVLKLYTIKDELSGESNPPVPQANDDVAIRTFYQAMRTNDMVADFNLYYVGDYNTETMLFDGLDVPDIIDTNDVKAKIMASFQNKPLPFGESYEKKPV